MSQITPENREAARKLINKFNLDPNDELKIAEFIAEKSLTDREMQIVVLVARGMPNKEMSAELQHAEDTLKHGLLQIFDKLGVSSRLELAMLAKKYGLSPKSEGSTNQTEKEK